VLSPLFSDLDAKVVATQLTLINAGYYSNITSTNFYRYMLESYLRRRSTADLAVRPAEHAQYAVECFLEREQQLTTWVALEVCSVSKLKTRRIVVHKFIKIAKMCLDNRDFFGAFAVTNGLYLPPVRRLKKTWEGISSADLKTLQQLSTLMEPQNNMENYRKLLETSKNPLVPFFRKLSVLNFSSLVRPEFLFFFSFFSISFLFIFFSFTFLLCNSHFVKRAPGAAGEE